MPFQVTSLGKLLSILGKYQGLGIDIELLCLWGHPCSASPSLGSSCFISSPYFPAPNTLFSGRSRDVKWGLPKSQTLSISLWWAQGGLSITWGATAAAAILESTQTGGSDDSQAGDAATSEQKGPKRGSTTLGGRQGAARGKEQRSGCTFTFALCLGCW